MLESVCGVLYGIGMVCNMLDVTFSTKMMLVRMHATNRYLIISYAAIALYGMLWPVTFPIHVTTRILLQNRERRNRQDAADLPPRF